MDSYSRNFCDPIKQRTLKIVNVRNIVLFYKHDNVKYLPFIPVCDNVTMLKNFSFTKGYKVDDYLYKPAELANYMENFIKKCINNAFKNLNIDDCFKSTNGFCKAKTIFKFCLTISFAKKF